MAKILCLLSHLVLAVHLRLASMTPQDGFLPTLKYESASVEAAVGRSARLACNMTVVHGDAVYLVLWFKQGLATPIYSYDVREVPAGKHWYDAELLGSRATFHAHSHTAASTGSFKQEGHSRNHFSVGSKTPAAPQSPHLLLRHLKQMDAGVYKCRVDFQKAPTMITRVNLTVVVPPESVVLTQESGRSVRGVVGPVREHHNLTLSCTVNGGELSNIFNGYPRPLIRWRIDGELLKEKENSPENALTTWTLETGLNINISFTNGVNNKSYDSVIDDGRGGFTIMESDPDVFPSIGHSYDRNKERRLGKVAIDRNGFEIEEDELLTKQRIPSHLATMSADGQVTKRWLTVYGVSRQLLMARIECSARNSKTLPPVTASAAIDMNLAPVGIHISTAEDLLISGRSADITCLSWGSRPPAVLSWWTNSTRLDIPSNLVWREGNESRAILRLSLNASFNGVTLTCRSVNPALPEQEGLIQRTTLVVKYAPIVALSPGRNLDLGRVTEGDDVYFECRVHANPAIRGGVVWRHNGSRVRENLPSGVLLMNRSLVLQSVSREQAGTYVCGASNKLGKTESAPLTLNVRYPPVCRTESPIVYGISLLEEATIICQVEAFPPVEGFVWWFNNSAETLELRGDTTHGSSFLQYTPSTDLDYGTLLCLAHNPVGKQQEPCTFQIIPAALPEAPTNCSLANVTSSGVTVICFPGFDGGLAQVFVLEVYTTKPQHLFANLTAKTPKFVVAGLSGETELQLIVYSGNAKGRSGGVARLVAHTPELPVKQLETRLDTDVVLPAQSSLWRVLVGVAVVVLLLCAVSVSIIKIHYNKRRQMQHASTSEESLRQPDSEAGAAVPSGQECGAERVAIAQEQQLMRSPPGEQNWAVQETTVEASPQRTGNTGTYSATSITPPRSSSRQRLVTTTPRYSHRPTADYGRGYVQQMKDSYSISRDATISCKDCPDKVQVQAQHSLTQHLLIRHPSKEEPQQMKNLPNQFASNPHLHQIEEIGLPSISSSHQPETSILRQCKCNSVVSEHLDCKHTLMPHHNSPSTQFSSNTLPSRSSSFTTSTSNVIAANQPQCLNYKSAAQTFGSSEIQSRIYCSTSNITSHPNPSRHQTSHPKRDAQFVQRLEDSIAEGGLEKRTPASDQVPGVSLYQCDVIAPAAEFQDSAPADTGESLQNSESRL